MSVDSVTIIAAAGLTGLILAHVVDCVNHPDIVKPVLVVRIGDVGRTVDGINTG